MTLPRPAMAVVFDMDGLLFDTERFYAETILTAAGEVGCPMRHDVFLQLVGRPATSTIAGLTPPG